MLFKKYRQNKDSPEITFANLTGQGNNKKFFSKWRFFWVIIIIIVIIILPYWWLSSTNNCSKRGSHSLFVADFDGDIIGSPPAPSTPLHYGPPGASLNIQGSSDTILIVDSTALGSQAMRITRGAPNPTEVEAVVGDIGDMPYTSGLLFIEFMAHAEEHSAPEIAAMSISVRSTEGNAALIMKLYDGSYRLKEGGSYIPIVGSYDPNTPHFIHIELDMDAGEYSICIDDEMVVAMKAFLGDFTNLHALHFFVAPTITEAFPTVYVVDDIRITK